jgi:hypothetical protein
MTQKNPTTKKWGFLVYIAGDNNLSSAGLEDIRELCDEGSSKEAYVGVEIDTYGELTGSIRYEITELDYTGQAYRTVIERLEEKDTGDPATLSSFLEWGLNRYPADHHVVVIWNHGSGFRSVRRDIAYDDFGSSLDMPEIEDAFNRSGIGKNNKISILGFDACLMNMLEIANHFSDHVEILVGSQQTEPGDGWPYDRVLHSMKTAKDCPEMARNIVTEYIKDYERLGVYNVTQSAIDVSKTEAAVQAMNHLGNLLADNIDQCRKELRKIRFHTQNFAMADYVDLVNLARNVSERIRNNDIRSAAANVIETAAACVISSESLGRVVKDANGLSVWFPAYENLYHHYRSKYLSLRCNTENSGWVRFLDSYFL